MILAQGFSRFALDLDGVVWTGDRPMDGAAETIASLRDASRRFVFCTNNSSFLPEHYAKKLAKMGAGGEPSEVVTSADATARLLRSTYSDLRGRTAFVIGGPGLSDAVRGAGVHILDGADATNVSMVVVGLDTKLTYDKLRIATIAIRAGAAFIASNEDPTLPAEDGQRPGAGAIVAAIRASTGRDPLVAGKPQPLILEIARERLQGSPALVIGDRIGTDILSARRMGWPSALVMTGASNVADLAASEIWPDAVLRGLPDLIEDLPHPLVRAATGPDLPAIAQLLHAGGLQAGNVRERAGRTVVAEAVRGQILATAAWDPAKNHAILRSVAVSHLARGKAVGLLVVAGALKTAARSGVSMVWLVTTNARSFFERCGFSAVKRDDLPDEVADHPQLDRDCPSTATVMSLSLPPFVAAT